MLPASASAQLRLARPHLDWRTIETPHFAFHYPPEVEEWTRHVAARAESMRAAVQAIVGWAPAGRVHVYVEDPQATPNASAHPALDRSAIVLWATPASPTIEIGDNPGWGELAFVHELTHVAHLARPSRRPSAERRALLSLLRQGPVRQVPRWVSEGYATYVEGRLLASGRPYHAWRAAVLRQWAIDGRLPSYEELAGSTRYRGNVQAYLAGSAFLDWLATRDTLSPTPDSSLVFL
jgi:hypothetical protein